MTLIDKAEALRIVTEECYKAREMKLAMCIEERIATLPARGVGVKPLQWNDAAFLEQYAKSAAGTYRVFEKDGLWRATVHTVDDAHFVAETEYLHDAQAAAQADYEARILAAFAPTDAAQATAGQRLIAAASEAAAIARGDAEPASVYVPDAAQAREVEVYYKLRWISTARPPVHPEPMNGSQTFSTEEKARAFFRRLPSDAKFVSLERVEVTSTALIGERT